MPTITTAVSTLSHSDAAMVETAWHEAGHAVVAAALHETPDLAVAFPTGVTTLDRRPYEQAIAHLRGVPWESIIFPRTEVGKVSWAYGPDESLAVLLKAGGVPREMLLAAARTTVLIDLAGSEAQRVFLRGVGRKGKPKGCSVDLASAIQSLGDTFTALGTPAGGRDFAVHLEMATLGRATRALVNWLYEPLALVADELAARTPDPMTGEDIDSIVDRWRDTLGEVESRKGARIIEQALA